MFPEFPLSQLSRKGPEHESAFGGSPVYLSFVLRLLSDALLLLF